MSEKKGKTYNSNWMVGLGPKQVISLRNTRFLTGSPLQVLTIQTLDLKDSSILQNSFSKGFLKKQRKSMQNNHDNTVPRSLKDFCDRINKNRDNSKKKTWTGFKTT